ncbi:MAG TPA: cation:proton antiporter [Herpetosiphonaceae bacterium]
MTMAPQIIGPPPGRFAAAAGSDGMSPLLQLILALAILIAVAKLAGMLSARFRQPAVLGELLAGIALGPSLLNVLHLPFFTDPQLEPTVFHLAELGVIFLMFVAGLEVKLDDLLAVGKTSSLVGALGVLVPLAAGTALAWWWPNGYTLAQCLFVGILLTATSVSISAQTLLELGQLRSRVGLTLLGAAVVDDILVIVLLSVFVALAAASGGVLAILLSLGAMALYFALASLFGLRLLPALTRQVVKWPVSQPLITLAVVLTLLAAWSAEALGGVAAITGAFLMGLFFGRTPYHNRIEAGMQPITYGLFVPIFFASIGLHANVFALEGGLAGFAALFCLVAVATKLIGCGLGAGLAGLPRREAFQVGAGMISRGEVGLIVATVGIREGIIQDNLFAVAVLMVLVTTLATPPLLRWAFSRPPADPAPAAAD